MNQVQARGGLRTRTEAAGLRIAVACLSLLFMYSFSARCLSARGKDSEAKLVAKIAREKKPVNKAKLEVRLGTVHLQQAIGAYEKRHIPQGQKLLASFLGDMENAWSILQASGRNAAKKPQGFQELEIALNEDARRLDDLRREVFYLYRAPIDQALSQVNQLHGKVLLTLFPGAAPPAAGHAASRVQASHFSSEVQHL
ncbi:MAG: hypothetical protein ACRD22_02265 [Terriglobia bacterium]